MSSLIDFRILDEDTALCVYPIEKELALRGLETSDYVREAFLTTRDTIRIETYENKDNYWARVKKYHGQIYVELKPPEIPQMPAKKKSSTLNLMLKRLSFKKKRPSQSRRPQEDEELGEVIPLIENLRWETFYRSETIENPQQPPVKKKLSLLNRLVSSVSLKKMPNEAPIQPETILTSVIEHYFDFERELTRSPSLVDIIKSLEKT